jgi:hypothetical protein
MPFLTMFLQIFRSDAALHLEWKVQRTKIFVEVNPRNPKGAAHRNIFMKIVN